MTYVVELKHVMPCRPYIRYKRSKPSRFSLFYFICLKHVGCIIGAMGHSGRMHERLPGHFWKTTTTPPTVVSATLRMCNGSHARNTMPKPPRPSARRIWRCARRSSTYPLESCRRTAHGIGSCLSSSRRSCRIARLRILRAASGEQFIGRPISSHESCSMCRHATACW
jgi:hypothetical protein